MDKYSILRETPWKKKSNGCASLNPINYAERNKIESGQCNIYP
jgi:hypothetical protein